MGAGFDQGLRGWEVGVLVVVIIYVGIDPGGQNDEGVDASGAVNEVVPCGELVDLGIKSVGFDGVPMPNERADVEGHATL